MEPNPYETPKDALPPQRDSKSRSKPFYRRRKPWWGYPVAAVLGAWIIGAIILAGPLADLDDAGALQMMIGAFLGVVIYVFLC